MAYDIDKFYELGVGDVVQLVDLEELQNTRYYTPSMGEWAGKTVVIGQTTTDSTFCIEGDGYRWQFHRDAIKELVEKRCFELPITRSVMNRLKGGDRVRFRDYDSLYENGYGESELQFAGQVVTIRVTSVPLFTIAEDDGYHTYNMSCLISKVLKEEPPTKAELRRREQEDKKALKITKYKHNIFFRSSDFPDYEYLNQFRLIKVTDDVDRIKSFGNSLGLSKAVAGKWIVVSSYSDKVLVKTNPHIAHTLSHFRCSNMRLSGWTSLGEEIEKITTESGVNVRLVTINFKTGAVSFDTIRDKTKCCRCGCDLTEQNKVGRYCRSCLTEREGLAYRFGYHSYNGGYPTPKKVDTKKVPVFGCEIERDYSSSANKSGMYFEDAMKNAMIEVIKKTQGDQLDRGKLERQQVFMSDGSLNNGGIEWITFPHTFDWYIKNKDKLDEAIKSIKHYGFTNTVQAGNHIHINRDFFIKKNGKTDAKFCASKMAVLISKYWREFCLIANRTRTGYTQKPEHEYNDDIFTLAEKTIRAQHEHGVAVNLQHTATIEIRLWGAIKDANELLFYLDNMQALARYVKKTSLERVQSAKLTDFMKYYKLPTSINRVKQRLAKVAGTDTYNDVCQLLEAKKEEKKAKRGNK